VRRRRPGAAAPPAELLARAAARWTVIGFEMQDARG
jgi:hypothetical protein